MTISSTTPSIKPLYGPTEPPGTGIYHDVPASVYHAWKLPSNSALNHMVRSPLHCRFAMDNPSEQTDAMRLGEAFHAHVLEPETFRERFAFAELCRASKADGTTCGNPGKIMAGGSWYCGVHGKGKADEFAASGMALLSASEWETLDGMANAIQAEPSAAKLMALPATNEATIVFDHPGTGVRCKMRADRIIQSARVSLVLDLKTTMDASPADFARTIYHRGYHRQAAMYLAGCAAAGVEVAAFAIVAVEKDRPHAVAVYQLDESDIAEGAAEIDQLLTRYAECEASGRWPGYSDRIEPIRLPAYARPRPETNQVEELSI